MGVLRALRIAAPASNPQRSEHPSYILGVLAEEFGSVAEYRSSIHVLDLGASVKENYEFYSTFSAHIHIEDLSSNLADTGAKPPNGAEPAIFSETTRICQVDGLDLIVCWDLFNYCTREQAAQLGKRLGDLAKPGTRLFTLVGTHAMIPARPRTFKITDKHRLVYEAATSETTTCPKFTKSEMDRFLPGFTRIRSFLLRNGMEEQLFVFE